MEERGGKISIAAHCVWCFADADAAAEVLMVAAVVMPAMADNDGFECETTTWTDFRVVMT